MASDPFSDILALVNAEAVLSGGFSAGGDWAIRFPARDKLKFCAIVRGRCWIQIENEEVSLEAVAGDVLLLTPGRSFVLFSQLSADPIDGAKVFAGNFGKILSLGGGDDFLQIGGHVQLDPINGKVLADVLPPWIHIHADSPQAPILQWILNQLVQEKSVDLIGAKTVFKQLAQLLFVQVIRAHQSGISDFPAGWLKALSDPQIGRAIRNLHDEPGRHWTLDELAKIAAMSRTNFALRFKMVAGVPPLTYLFNWRMQLAEQELRVKKTPIATLAQSLGYTSESAFSNAFKRINGMAPKTYRDLAEN
jgi:AraC-like DNA-binding protein